MSRSRTIRRPEQAIQKAVFDHIRQRGVPGLVAWHTPNGAAYGGKKNRKGIAIQGSIMAGLGVRKGVSDVICVHNRKIYAMELKAPGGRATEEQLEFLSDMDRAGAFTALPGDLDAALATLEAWGLLRGKLSPASQGSTGGRPSEQTEPEVLRGAARAALKGEGSEASQQSDTPTGCRVTVKAVA